MRSISTAILLIACATASSNGQGAPSQHDTATSLAVMRIKALQNQINKQQTQINALRSRLRTLQDTMQDLADMIADQSSDTDEDDVSGFVVKSPSVGAKRSAPATVRSAMATCRNPSVSNHRCGIQ